MRVSSLPFPSQSQVTAFTPRAPPTASMEFGDSLLYPRQSEPSTFPLRNGGSVNLHSLRQCTYTHSFPLCVPWVPDPTETPCLGPCPEPRPPPGRASLLGRSRQSHPVPARLGSHGQKRLQGRGSRAAADPRVGAGAGAAAGAGSRRRARGRDAAGPGAAAGAYPAALSTGPAGGERPPGPGEEGAARRGRSRRLVEPGLAPPPATPQAPPTFKDPTFPGAPFSPQRSAGPQTRSLAGRNGGDLT